MKRTPSAVKGKHQDMQSHEVHMAAVSQGMSTVFERFEARQPQCGHWLASGYLRYPPQAP